MQITKQKSDGSLFFAPNLFQPSVALLYPLKKLEDLYFS